MNKEEKLRLSDAINNILYRYNENGKKTMYALFQIYLGCQSTSHQKSTLVKELIDIYRFDGVKALKVATYQKLVD
jgi:hypothetical protein